MRIVKDPDIRRAEILSVANELFKIKGYTKTAVDEIVRQAGIAKGTFYHYFKSKEDILDALTEQLVTDMAIHAEQTVNNKNFNAVEKLVIIISEQNTLIDEKQDVVESMHLPENRELHDRINIKTVQFLGPILAKVIEQGNKEGLFQVDDPLSTVQFILAGSLFLLGDGIFNWNIEEKQARNNAMLILIERTFAAPKGLIVSSLNNCINKDSS